MRKLMLLARAIILIGGVVALVFILRHRQDIKQLEVSEQEKEKEKSVEDRVTEFGKIADARLVPFFREKKIAYPPKQIVFLGFKEEKRLELWAANKNGQPKFIRSYPILGASGVAGPKLREGDLQVPEGFYKIESLNPNSLFHLSLRVNYPNEFDRARAKEEQREEPGTDIMIHGNKASIGCLAMGDEAAEDLFILAAKTGIENIEVILSPIDFRTGANVEAQNELPQWTGDLYERIKSALSKFPKP